MRNGISSNMIENFANFNESFHDRLKNINCFKNIVNFDEKYQLYKCF